jgi:hypothetical protein
MRISKNDLCASCRKIHPVTNDGTISSVSIENLLDGKPYQSFAFGVINQAILIHLEGNGGCPSCISLLKRAIAS